MKEIENKKVNPTSGIRYKRGWEFNPSTDGEKPTGKSMTVPDDAYDLRTLLERYTRGLPLDTKQGMFPDEGEADIDDIDLEAFNRLDITEREEIIREMQAKITAAEIKKYGMTQTEKPAEKDEKTKDEKG